MFLRRIKDAPTSVYVIVTHALFMTCFIVVIQELRNGLWRWQDLFTFVATFHLVGIGITVFYHRYFTHRAFAFTNVGSWTARPLLALVAMASWLGPPKVWSAVHQRHHQHADNAGDPHGPIRSAVDFVYVGLILFTPRLFDDAWIDAAIRRRDVTADWFEKYVCSSMGYLILGIIIPITLTFYWGLAAWYIAGVASAFYATQVVNTVGHSSELLRKLPTWMRSIAEQLFYRPHAGRQCADTLNLRPWVAWLGGYGTAGELNHNSHHMYPTSARVGHHWYDCDLGWWTIRLMEIVGLAYRVQRPPTQQALGRDSKHG